LKKDKKFTISAKKVLTTHTAFDILTKLSRCALRENFPVMEKFSS